MWRQRLDVGICGWTLNKARHDNPEFSQFLPTVVYNEQARCHW
jgi:hypothetical protein